MSSYAIYASDLANQATSRSMEWASSLILNICLNSHQRKTGMRGSNHCLFDRCSISWTIDESFSSRDAWNITLQRTMISEPLNVAGHKNYPEGTQHGYAGSIGGNTGSFHHNLIAHAEGRSWSMAGGLDNAANFNGQLSIVNNVVYNFGERQLHPSGVDFDLLATKQVTVPPTAAPVRLILSTTTIKEVQPPPSSTRSKLNMRITFLAPSNITAMAMSCRVSSTKLRPKCSIRRRVMALDHALLG